MLSIEKAPVYDVEIFPNAFTLRMELLNSAESAVWEISEFRDDSVQLISWFDYLWRTQTPMIGFNNVHFDYVLIHFIFKNPNATPRQIYDKGMSIIEGNDRFANTIWANDRFAPQIDLFKMHHFDNKAKSTGLKALQINMRSPSVVDMPVELGSILTKEQIDNLVIPYNGHDVKETKKFAHLSMEAINFRLSLVPQFGVDVMNWPDTKIGARMIEEKLGRDLCYETKYEGNYSRRVIRQTPRYRIALKDIIFPYVRFENPEFNRILQYLKDQVLTGGEIDQFSETPQTVQTKGVFKDLKATINGFEFHFGTGGIHGSVSSQRVCASSEWLLRDIDVSSLYPSIAITNNLAPEHLGEPFIQIYSELPKERKKWQELKGKKCVEANAIKLASNGVYGNSNNIYSIFYDPQYTLTITINGQLMLCMLAEKLMEIPTLKIIQINTDGITYLIHRDKEPFAVAACREWEKLTKLVLEDSNYSRMFIRDVNNYVAESVDGSLKCKGAYWFPDPVDYYGSISSSQPPAWHKDLGNLASIRAAVANMIHGVDVYDFLKFTNNPYDFACRAKVKRSDRLLWGDTEVQRNTRYYVSTNGRPLIKRSLPSGPLGAYKKANGIHQADYDRVMLETGGQWDARVCTKNRSRYENRETAIQAGFTVTICNNIADFSFDNVNYDWYANEAFKLIVT